MFCTTLVHSAQNLLKPPDAFFHVYIYLPVTAHSLHADVNSRSPNQLTRCNTSHHLISFLSFSFLPSSYHLLTFWLCQPSHLCSPVSCLIIEVSACLQGAAQYLLIKASVCVCLFISDCYSRRSPQALMRYKPPLPTEAYTVSCHCTFSHSKAFHGKM